MKKIEETFLTVLRSADVGFYRKPEKKDKYSYRETNFVLLSNKEKKELDLDKHYLYIHWCTGGISGGSCWDTGEGADPHYAMDGEKEPEFDDLDTALLAIAPNISFLQYKKITTVINQDSYTEPEYYGNCTYYAYKCVLLRNLFNKLVELELL